MGIADAWGGHPKPKRKVRVSYETLGGNVVRKTFDTWDEAEAFGSAKEAQSGIQWVDIEEVG